MAKKFFNDVEIKEYGVTFIVKPYFETNNFMKGEDPLNYIELDSIKLNNVEMLNWFIEKADQTYEKYRELIIDKIYNTIINDNFFVNENSEV